MNYEQVVLSAFDLDGELGSHKPFEAGMMPSSFHKILSPVHLAVADLTTYDYGYILNRINVPKAFRGRGEGTWLLNKVIEAADQHDTSIWLSVSPSDGLNKGQLTAWYKRHGWVEVYGEPGLMLRVRASIRNK
jgi:GNAT superfamily N-acetyltransferase